MLMLDIAVVNTAMSQIARDLDAGLSGLQWVVDAYTLALASVVLIVGLVATAAWVCESRDPHFRPVDWVGQITLTGGLFLLVLALLRGNDAGWSSRAIVAELGGAAVLLVGFAIAELRGRAPMLPPA